MTLKYDISQIGRPWCLNDRLDLINPTRPSDLADKLFKNKKIWKRVRNIFPLYILKILCSLGNTWGAVWE